MLTLTLPLTRRRAARRAAGRRAAARAADARDGQPLHAARPRVPTRGQEPAPRPLRAVRAARSVQRGGRVLRGASP